MQPLITSIAICNVERRCIKFAHSLELSSSQLCVCTPCDCHCLDRDSRLTSLARPLFAIVTFILGHSRNFTSYSEQHHCQLQRVWWRGMLRLDASMRLTAASRCLTGARFLCWSALRLVQGNLFRHAGQLSFKGALEDRSAVANVGRLFYTNFKLPNWATCKKCWSRVTSATKN